MEAARNDRRAIEPCRQLASEKNIAELGPAIGAEGAPATRPREIVDTFARGDPYAPGGMSAGPDAPLPSSHGSGKELRPLDPTTGATKNAFGKTYPTGDGAASTSDIIHALAQKENEMMKRIRAEISVFVKTHWH